MEQNETIYEGLDAKLLLNNGSYLKVTELENSVHVIVIEADGNCAEEAILDK